MKRRRSHRDTDILDVNKFSPPPRKARTHEARRHPPRHGDHRDAPGNVDFYARVLGLRLVKKTVNQDDPTVYHLFYADERGSAGADMTFFEYPGARRGRAGAGMVHTVVWRVASEDALDFWERRLAAEGVSASRERPAGCASPTRRGSESSWRWSRPTTSRSWPSRRRSPREHALQGFDGVRAFAAEPERSAQLLQDALGFEAHGEDGGTRSAATAAAASTPTTRPRPSAASAAPARSTTSPSPPPWRSTRPGASGRASTVRPRPP